MTKRLNIWVQNADNQYIDVDKFLACGSDRKLDYFAGRECYAGLDLSSGGDLTTLALGNSVCRRRQAEILFVVTFIHAERDCRSI